MHDFDRDGLPDLTYASVDMGVYTYRNTGSGFEYIFLFGAIGGLIAHPIWVDYDNDGDSDFFATRGHDCPVLMRNDGNLTFTDVSYSLECPFDQPYSTCASWGDYNNDGWIDLYIANYYTNPPGPTSWFYRNNGDGSFTQMAEELNIENGILPAYQVLWVDYDMDLDQDLLVCNDKYAGNKLYRNNGDGTFEDWSEESGFSVELDAMSLSVSDFDHDLDYDFYISNTESGNYFMINADGVMSNQADSLNTEVNAQCWGTVFIDTEGKGWEDLYVVNTSIIGANVMLRNQLGTYFNEDHSALGQDDTEYIYSAAKGDIDGNGSYDIAVNPLMNNNSLLFQSSRAFEGWVGVDLRGTVSNRDGIGAHVSCFAGGVHYIRPKTCGENFLSQDSQYLLFATKDEPVDSIVVQWPSGVRDVIYTPEMNQTHLVIESLPQSMVQSMELMLCAGGSLHLQPEGAQQVVWSDGSSELFIEVNEPGSYGAEILDEQGHYYEVLYNVTAAPGLQVELQVNQPSCPGMTDGAIHWFSDGFFNVWVNDILIESDYAVDLTPGTYQLKFVDTYGCITESEATLHDPLPLLVSQVVTPGCYGDSSQYTIIVTNAQGPALVSGLSGFDGYLPHGSYHYTVEDQMGCTHSDTLIVETMPLFMVEDYRDTVCAAQLYTPVQLQFIGGVEPWQSVGDPLPLDAMTVGEYLVEWMDAAGCVTEGLITILQHESIEVEVESNVDHIFLEIEGGVPPYDILWNTGESGSMISGSPGVYTFTISDGAQCSYQGEAELLVNIGDVDFPAISVYPMPFDDVLRWDGARPVSWLVMNAQGQPVAHPGTFIWGTWDTACWPSGVYFARLWWGDSGQQTIKLVKR